MLLPCCQVRIATPPAQCFEGGENNKKKQGWFLLQPDYLLNGNISTLKHEIEEGKIRKVMLELARIWGYITHSSLSDSLSQSTPKRSWAGLDDRSCNKTVEKSNCREVQEAYFPDTPHKSFFSWWKVMCRPKHQRKPGDCFQALLLACRVTVNHLLGPEFPRMLLLKES